MNIFTPRRARHALSVLAAYGAGTLLLASPALAVTAHTFTSSFDATPAPGTPSNLTGIAVDQSATASAADVYVAVYGTGTVAKLGPAGDYLSQLTNAAGTEPFVFANLAAGGIAVDPGSGDVYVVDSGAAGAEPSIVPTVYKFDPAGKNISGYHLGGAGFSGFTTPAGLAVNSAGDLYVSDVTANAIDEFDPSGTYIPHPAGKFAVSSPAGIAIDSNDNTYVVNGGYHEVDQFDSNGTLLSVFDSPAPGDPVFGVAVDRSTDHVYDLAGFQTFLGGQVGIFEYDSSGNLIYRFGAGRVAGGFNVLGEVAVSGAGRVYAFDQSFSSFDVFDPATLPDVTTTTATSVDPATETVAGTIGADNGPEATCSFEYGTDPSYSLPPVPCAPAGPFTGAGVEAVSGELTGLDPNTTYLYRTVGTNANGSNDGTGTRSPEGSFTTAAAKPVLEGQPTTASGITRASVTLAGSVDPRHSDTTYRFQYGVSEGYGLASAPLDVGSGLGEVGVSGVLNGLVPSTTYHYRLTATNQAGTSRGVDRTFTTPAGTPPAATTTGASAVTQTTATLSATVASQGLQTSYRFDFGTTTAYGIPIFGDAGSSRNAIPISVSLAGLSPGTTYHYRVVAINLDGTTTGADESFTTPAFPQGTLAPPALTQLLPTSLVPQPAGKESATATPPKRLTRSQKLKKALKACKIKRSKSRRKACEAATQKRFGPSKKS